MYNYLKLPLKKKLKIFLNIKSPLASLVLGYGNIIYNPIYYLLNI